MIVSHFLILTVLGILQISDVHAQVKVTLPHGGSLVGTIMNTVRGRKIDAFLGVPYAKPPTGLLRFKPPIPAQYWSGTKPAQTPGSACPQTDIFSINKVPFGDEDCLYLNIYTPQARPSDNLPVMVWIHGGSYHMGSSDPIVFGPEQILENDVILVTFNYRLGALGFLSTGTLDAPGNCGLKDQQLVLQWVKENIKAFGGNLHDVTLFGQSAGSASVSLHMVSDQKAILQGGNLFDPWALVDYRTSIARLKQLGDLVNCPLHNRNFGKMVSCLRDVPADQLVSTIGSFYIDDTYFPYTVFGPVIVPNTTDAFLPEDPRNIIGSYGNSIPIVIGRNADEGIGRSGPILHQHDIHFRANFNTVLPKLLEYDHKPDHIKRKITERIDYFYFRGRHNWSQSKHYRLTDLFTDRLFSFGMDQFLRNRFSAMHRPIGKTYLYIFSHRGPTSTSEIVGGGPNFYGISNGDELQFLFPQGQLNIPGTKADQLMRWTMPNMWTEFAWTGDPTPQGTIIREYWKSTYGFPLRFVQIGKKFSPTKYRANAIELYRANNVTDTDDYESADLSSYRTEDKNANPSRPEADFGNESKKNGDEDETISRRHRTKNYKHYHMLRNRKRLIEKRIEFWRGMERLLN